MTCPNCGVSCSAGRRKCTTHHCKTRSPRLRRTVSRPASAHVGLPATRMFVLAQLRGQRSLLQACSSEEGGALAFSEEEGQSSWSWPHSAVFCGSPQDGGSACFSGHDASDSDYFRDSPGRTCRDGLYGAAGGDQAEAHGARQNLSKLEDVGDPALADLVAARKADKETLRDSKPTSQRLKLAQDARDKAARKRRQVGEEMMDGGRRCGFFWRRRIRLGGGLGARSGQQEVDGWAT